MEKETFARMVLALFFLAGGIMALNGILIYVGWNDLPNYSIVGMGFMLGSFTQKFFGRY